MTQNEKFLKYYELLVEWNNKFNLTAVTDRDKVELLHFRDSVLPVDLIPRNAKLLDVGSGAGFPGIPIKIMRDDVRVTLIDSVNKKVTFMQEAIRELGLFGIEAVHCRIEEFKERGAFDVVTSRAVAPLNVLVEYCLPFVKQGGFMLAYKAADIGDELQGAVNAITLLGGDMPMVMRRKLDDEISRSFVVIKKIKETPSGYPRGGNKPRSKPIV